MKKVPEHPGRQLGKLIGKEFTSIREFARHINVSDELVRTIITGKRAISVATAIRLACVFKTAEFWWLAQCKYDLYKNRELENSISLELQDHWKKIAE
jgi:addiction module HigA family antidote